MKKTRINGHNVEIFDNIDELPIIRFQKFNKLLLIESGIGGDLADYVRHLERLKLYAEKRDFNKLSIEFQNMQQNINFLIEGVNPRLMAFGCLVASIDGEPQKIDDDSLKGLIEKISGASYREVSDILSETKKKINSELALYFPKIFESGERNEFFDLVRRRTESALEAIISGEDRKERISDLDDKLLLFAKPMQFIGPQSAEIKSDKDFEKMCVSMSSELKIDVKTKSVLAFYSAYEHLIERNKEREKAYRAK